jgi:hypothetical protein
MSEGTTTVTSGPQRCNLDPAMSRASEGYQGRGDRRALDGMQEVRVEIALKLPLLGAVFGP